MDKQFYEGTIKSYDPIKKKHVILYDDEDVEVLRLDKERWELLDYGRKPTKKSKSNSLKHASLIQVSSGKKNKLSGGSRQNKKSMKDKGKRTPKKSLKDRPKFASKNYFSEDEDSEKTDVSDPKPPTVSKVLETNSGDSQGKRADMEDENLTDKEESDKEFKLISEERDVEDTEGNLNGEDESDEVDKMDSEEKPAEEVGSVPQDEKSDEEDKEEAESSKGSREEANEDGKSDSEGNEEINGDGSSPMNPEKSQNELPKPVDADDAEISDDEPLSKWKLKVGKSGSRRVG